MIVKLRNLPKWKRHIYSVLISVFCMSIAVLCSFLYCSYVPDYSANIALFFILALIMIARLSYSYIYGIACSIIAVVGINYFFTYPFFQINFALTGYPVTFLILLVISIMTSTMTSHLTLQAKLIAEREKQLSEVKMEQMRANLLRAISHDIRTPLTGILGNASVLLEKKDKLHSREQAEIITNIYNDANWLLHMTENLLTITRIQGDNFNINTREESVEEVVSEALQRFQKRYPHAIIHVQVPDELLFLPMDAILIEQVTINLLENAIIHSSSTQPIELIIDNLPNSVSFTIRDYGVGIPQSKIKNLFDGTSCSQSHTSDAHKGMGIGLSICKTIITAHHGTLTGRNHKAGAEFVFCLPKSANERTDSR